MAEYGKIFSRIWSDLHFTALKARAQQMYAMLCSHSTRNMAGVLPLTLKRWAKSTSDATIENVTAALNELAANRFIVIDWDTEEVLIRTFIRNDEVYRQPNLMKAALKFARQVESPALRWALHDELMRLPDHKDADVTERTANALVEGLERTPPEPFPEPFDEPMPKPQGVGGYLSGVRDAPFTGNLKPSPAAAPIADTATDPIAATTGAELVRRIIPREHPDAVKTALRIRASELINTGTPSADVEAALELWLTKPNVGPNVLASLVSEVIKARAPASRNGLRVATSDRRVAEIQALKHRPPTRLELEP